MKKDGYETPKPLLEILGIPNIERTVILLNKFGIHDIAVLIQEKHKLLFNFLNEKYNCKLISDSQHFNTLYSMNNVLDKFSNTFVIEGDVVLTKNIFIKSEYSFYYVMKYLNCEEDAWHPVMEKGKINYFEIGNFSEPCLFGVSYWSSKDCNLLQCELKKYFTEENFKNPHLFWDDCITNILSNITIKTHEISPYDACEMNTKEEYKFAQEISSKYYHNCKKFLADMPCFVQGSSTSLLFIEDIESCKEWQCKLVKYINRVTGYNEVIEEASSIVFNEGEYPYMIKQNYSDNYIAYIDIAETTNYILLRRIYIDEIYRNKKIGTTIVNHIKAYSLLSNKELRVNDYDEKVEKFYTTLGLKLYFKTFRI